MQGTPDYMTVEREGRRYQFVYDEHHQTVGSYGYETEEETKAAEDEEIEKLRSGEWVVLGCIVSRPCPGAIPPEDRSHSGEDHCPCCAGWEVIDSLWGIVVENDAAAVEALIGKDGLLV